MASDFAVRLLSLAVTGLAATLVGTNAAWISWATEPSIGRALAARRSPAPPR
ncbi:hypothetical protein GA0074692_4108 [Micromonospora pallida]|uniref:Uncharacterized protein n=1 Tax=Micromonospora pallida TaxID=145854 RepID=A0A1C6T1I2_9ACTN|nr:hypothetical protein [Micromonospora pallida]SCL35499.1 hypothetical protein GA0074692_4108 [Micromonospora pallida]